MKEEKGCSYSVNGYPCGRQAVAVVKLTQGKFLQVDTSKDELSRNMGRGTGSLWIPLCEIHRHEYPDHEGFELDAK